MGGHFACNGDPGSVELLTNSKSMDIEEGWGTGDLRF
jgi:hypothetical protein